MTIYKVGKTPLNLPKLRKTKKNVVELLRNKKHVLISEILEKRLDFSKVTQSLFPDCRSCSTAQYVWLQTQLHL